MNACMANDAHTLTGSTCIVFSSQLLSTVCSPSHRGLPAAQLETASLLQSSYKCCLKQYLTASHTESLIKVSTTQAAEVYNIPGHTYLSALFLVQIWCTV